MSGAVRIVVVRFACAALFGLAGAWPLWCAAPAAAQSGTLEQVREQVRQPSEPSSSEQHSSSGGGGSSCDDDDSIPGELFCYAIIAPWSVPHCLADDDFNRFAFFPGFPYERGPGYLAIEPGQPELYKTWGGHIEGEFADNFDNLNRSGGRLLLEHTIRLGIDTEWNYWHENLGDGAHDQLWTGDANLVFRFAQNPYLAMRSGVGVNWLSDRQRTDTGFNFTYGIELFPVKPLVLSADIDWGWLGNRTLFHGRATAGVVIQHAEVYVGYDYYDVGDAAINGLVAGVRLWF